MAGLVPHYDAPHRYGQYVKGLAIELAAAVKPPAQPDGEQSDDPIDAADVDRRLESKWMAARFENGRKLHKAIQEFSHYISVNRAFIPNYGDRYRHGEAISTAFVESTVNQVVSKRMLKQQQMRWTQEGAHLLLQIRTQALNGDLQGTFWSWSL